jgi:Na+/melibiose symporter-like transporter
MIATTALYLIYLFFSQPYEEKRQNQLSLLNEFFVLIISFCLIGFCNDNLSSDSQESLGWFLIAWINLIAGFNMLIALYKTVKETYDPPRKMLSKEKNSYANG